MPVAAAKITLTDCVYVIEARETGTIPDTASKANPAGMAHPFKEIARIDAADSECFDPTGPGDCRAEPDLGLGTNRFVSGGTEYRTLLTELSSSGKGRCTDVEFKVELFEKYDNLTLGGNATVTVAGVTVAAAGSATFSTISSWTRTFKIRLCCTETDDGCAFGTCSIKRPSSGSL